MESKENVFYIFDHNENEKFCIYGLENLIQWLNESDDNYSFSMLSNGGNDDN